MEYSSMAIDEYAAYETVNGYKLIKQHGVWWRRVRPFYYRPLFPFQEIDPKTLTAQIGLMWGGYQHVVPPACRGNSYMNFLVFDVVQGYSEKFLSRNHRKNLRKAQKRLQIEPVADAESLRREGHRIYLSSLNRTGYTWNANLKHRAGFERWIDGIFAMPKVLILGAYAKSRIVAFSMSCLVEDVVICSTLLECDEALSLRAAELTIHVTRGIAANSPSARFVFMGSHGQKRSLDYFKVSRGCRLIAKPAFLRINPITKAFLRIARKTDYAKLTGMSQEEADLAVRRWTV